MSEQFFWLQPGLAVYNFLAPSMRESYVTRSGLAGILPFFLFGWFLLATTPGEANAAETHTEFNVRENREKEGNIFELVFGAAPPLATQRGILLIEAYFDENEDGKRDDGEKDLDREIFCLVDDIEYDVPAFIPGLAYQGSYKILCAGERYQPVIKRENLFVERRGQILKVDIPCRPNRDETARYLSVP